MPEFSIRKIEIHDLDKIAAIHKASFTDRALSQLGMPAIKRYYQWLLVGFPDNYPLSAISIEGKIAGFCFAGDYSGSFSGFLKRNRGFLFARVLFRPWLIFNPVIREQSTLALRTLLGLSRNKKITTQHSNPLNSENQQAKSTRSFGILAIAVNPDFQRQGIGQILMDAAESKALAGGYKQMHLSVHPDNNPAVRFYEKLGWQKIYHEDNWTGKMSKLIS